MRRCYGLALAAIAALAALSVAAIAPAQQGSSAGYPTSRVRFTQRDRRVKVVLLAGSIGAFRDQPYGRLFQTWCTNIEVLNLSRVGEGAPQLLTRFRDDVVPRVPRNNVELWLLFGGGLNSVGNSHQTNRSIRSLFTLAHRRRFGVVAMTLTPWGSETDTGRWTRGRGLHLFRNTRNVVDFVLGRLTPAQALGHYRNERREAPHPDAPWAVEERPDVAIDLYDSILRDRYATPWNVRVVREWLERDPVWQRTVAGKSPIEREIQLTADVITFSEAPRWFLREEYRGFDHIHPNREGHRAIADIACPRLPASWGCACPRPAQ